jgi:hypothetical protein
MAIFANGPDYQTTSVGTAPVAIFYTKGFGGTALASGTVMHNPTVVNAGTVSIYVGNGTIATGGATLGTSATQLQAGGVLLPAGCQMVIFGTAVAGTATTFGQNTFDLFACTAANTVTVEAAYATQAIVS